MSLRNNPLQLWAALSALLLGAAVALIAFYAPLDADQA